MRQKKALIQRTCKNCGKIFAVHQYRLNQNPCIFCSHKCMCIYQKEIYAKNRLKKICKGCGKQFSIPPSAAKDGYRKFCSLECRKKYNRIERICQHCGKKFYIMLNEIKRRGNNAGKFCSKKCCDKAKICTIERYCENCGKKFTTWPSQVKHRGAKFCSHHCATSGKNNPMFGRVIQKAETHWNWKGGRTLLRSRIHNSFKYRQWRSDIFVRDNYTCQDCGKRGGYLEAHHLKEFNKIMEENNIQTYEEAMQCEELWNINNGKTLCKDCHNLTKLGKFYPKTGMKARMFQNLFSEN